jgi:integrase
MLNANQVKAALPAEKPYRLFDSKGLYLQVQPNGSKYWRLKYRHLGVEKLLALGVYPEVTLTEARSKRDAARSEVAKGDNPSAARKAAKAATVAATANCLESVFGDWMTSRKGLNFEHKTEKRHCDIFAEHLLQPLGKIPLSEITAEQILSIVKKQKPQAAFRINCTLKMVFAYGLATGKCSYNLPDQLKTALPKATKKHHPALTEPQSVAELLKAINRYPNHQPRAALKLLSYCFCRPSELMNLTWSEVNFAENRIEISAERMKMAFPHIIPLSRQARALIDSLANDSEFVFKGQSGKKPLNAMVLHYVLNQLGYTGIQTPHGFRATARTILDEVLNFRFEFIEHQLAHTVRDTNGRAYNRTKHLDQRREMMQTWADYLDGLAAI